MLSCALAYLTSLILVAQTQSRIWRKTRIRATTNHSWNDTQRCAFPFYIFTHTVLVLQPAWSWWGAYPNHQGAKGRQRWLGPPHGGQPPWKNERCGTSDAQSVTRRSPSGSAFTLASISSFRQRRIVEMLELNVIWIFIFYANADRQSQKNWP